MSTSYDFTSPHVWSPPFTELPFRAATSVQHWSTVLRSWPTALPFCMYLPNAWSIVTVAFRNPQAMPVSVSTLISSSPYIP